MGKKQQSSIERLPADILEQLQVLLRDPRVTQLDATYKINEILAADGHPERLSKSAVNRYAVRMEEVGAKLRETREVARMWIGQLGAEPQGEVGKLLNEMVRTLAFRVAMRASEAGDDEPIDPAMLKSLAISVHRLEQAAAENVKLEEEIRRKERERLKSEFDKAAGKISASKQISPETLQRIREEVYGLV